ncbi:MAG: tRNA adenosine(34) deaminase TadA [Desulfobacterales bacterium]|nr:tRNA adenosine(34) deaminase TadA [Desulfobacterales bacterium]
MPTDHVEMMQLALAEARKAAAMDEVPVGAVLVSASGLILARGHNQPVTRNDPTAHAEILVLRQAAEKVGNYRLPGTTLYVTLEPCIMCMGGLLHARVTRVVFGASDPKGGAVESLYRIAADDRLNHRIETVGGVCLEECRAILQDFFRSRRKSIANSLSMP